MTSSVESVLHVLRSRLNQSLLSQLNRQPLAEAVPQYVELLRELADTVPDRTKLWEDAPVFDASLQLCSPANRGSRDGIAPNKHGVVVLAEQPLSLWNAVLPWETSLGLSYVALSRAVSPSCSSAPEKQDDDKNSNSSGSDSQLSAEVPEAKATEKKRSRSAVPGMLFASMGLTDASSPKHLASRESFVKVSESEPVSFWSGGIVEPIDVLFLDNNIPVPLEAVSRSRDHGPLAKALAEAHYSSPLRHVARLDPFPSSSGATATEAAAAAAASSLSSVSIFGRSLKKTLVHDVSLPPERKRAPFFVLELPDGACKQLLLNSSSSTAGGSDDQDSSRLTVSVRLSRPLCLDIDRKQLISTHFCPAIDSGASILLRRLCSEVLQPGAHHVHAAHQQQQPSHPFHTLSPVDVELVSLCCRMGVGDARHVMAAWELLADSVSRQMRQLSVVSADCSSKIITGGAGDDDNKSGPVGADASLKKICEMIGVICADRSVYVPDSLHRLSSLSL